MFLFRGLFVAFCGYRCTRSSTTTITTLSNMQSNTISYINSSTAQGIDEMLMRQPGFSLDQLMELAG